MNGFDFYTPWAFLALPLPLLASHWLPRRRHADGSALRIPQTISVSGTLGRKGIESDAVSSILPWLVWVLLVLALAGPQIIVDAGRLAASGRDIILAVDLSGSMVRQDFSIDGQPASRIDALKKIGADLIRRRAGDRIGLVVFADEAFAPTSPSFDTGSVARLLEDTSIGMVGRSTAIGDGMGLALKRLSQSDAPSKIMILLSDGGNDAGTTLPLHVARLANVVGVRIFTVALGQNDSESGSDDPDAVDSATLRQIAQVSGGSTFRVRTTEDLDNAVHTIETLIATRAPSPSRVVYRALWIYPGTVALVLTMLLILRGRRLR
jgi:Ca-activated chloride channel family protein